MMTFLDLWMTVADACDLDFSKLFNILVSDCIMSQMGALPTDENWLDYQSERAAPRGSLYLKDSEKQSS